MEAPSILAVTSAVFVYCDLEKSVFVLYVMKIRSFVSRKGILKVLLSIHSTSTCSSIEAVAVLEP
ncbi:hypothetical protein BCAMP_03230 [Brochothrix campestris FSL F6-1037]|uniref:Uncharacterized protein n=1 Tax=Brochothrix campestris FSL F6-1037 TaxID=1265861 RepID=W7D8A1_9LIST|nr:hypothetical protein BCAMP_03230 [Brochothrix campestris FSL F6-1037]